MNDDKKMNKLFEIVDKWKYEQAFSECRKLRTIIKPMLGRNFTVLSGKYYDCE